MTKANNFTRTSEIMSLANTVFSELATDRKKRGADKISTIPVVVETASQPNKSTPPWLRGKSPNTKEVLHLKSILRTHKLHTVCEEAACPNLPECFGRGTATFMIMGDICTRRCAFCDVAHGNPYRLDPDEPHNLSKVIASMGLRYVVITSVDRDDLEDGGALHFIKCIDSIRLLDLNIKIEILVPDFRNKTELAIKLLSDQPPDVFNHNIETVPRLYKRLRPGSNYQNSLILLSDFKQRNPSVPTKSGIMLGLGENQAEVITVMRDLRKHHCEIITLGQYLSPSKYHAPVEKYIHPDEFKFYKSLAIEMGFKMVNSGPLVRSSYHAEELFTD